MGGRLFIKREKPGGVRRCFGIHSKHKGGLKKDIALGKIRPVERGRR